jgi:hypothetical protein
LLALEAAQGTQFGAGEQPRDVQPGMGEINLLPAQGAQFGRSQAVPERQLTG